jgi:hypothetical protein
MYGRLLRYLLPCPLALSGCALIGYDLEATHGAEAGDADGGAAITGGSGGSSSGAGGGSGASGRWAWWTYQPGFGGRAGTAGSAGAAPIDAGANDPAACLGRSNGAPCEDGLFCTVGDRCFGGSCLSGVERDCSAQATVCNLAECSEADAACVLRPAFDGVAFGCGDGEFCVGGACVAGESCPSGENCDYSCPGTTCNYQCSEANRCAIDCAGGSTCLVATCRNADCEVSCAAGSSCILNCFGAHDCHHVVCSDGARCAMNCAFADNCEFESCGDPAGARLCGDGWIVCNADCP